MPSVNNSASQINKPFPLPIQETLRYLRASYEIVRLLYEVYAEAGEDVALEMRFLGEFQTSTWIRLSTLDDNATLKKYLKALQYWNLSQRFNAYISNATHSWDKVKQKLERRRAQGYKTAKGDRSTVYPYIATLTWDLDLEALHATKTVESREKAIAMAKEIWERKLQPFFESIGMYPRFVLYTGGGLQLKFAGDALYTIDVLGEFANLVDVISAISGPEAKADNIFDPARIVRAPFTINWGYKTPTGEIIPLLGAGIKKYDDAEVDFTELAKALREWADEHGLELAPKVTEVDMGAVDELTVPAKIRMRQINPEEVYTLLKPFYLSGHQNDLLIRLFTLLARYRVDLFSALKLLSLFVHDPKNTPDHVRNRLDQLTYPYGVVFNRIYRYPLTKVYGPDLYERAAQFYNALVADLGVSYSASDFKRGLEYSDASRLAGWPALKQVLLRVAESTLGHDQAERLVNKVLRILGDMMSEAPLIGGDDQ